MESAPQDSDESVLSISNLGSDGSGSPTVRFTLTGNGNDVRRHTGNESDDDIDVETVDDDAIYVPLKEEQSREKTFWECYPELLKYGGDFPTPVLPIPFGYYDYPPLPFCHPAPLQPILPMPVMTSSPSVPLNHCITQTEEIPSPTTSTESSSPLEKQFQSTGGNPRKRNYSDSPISRHRDDSPSEDKRKHICDECGQRFSRSNTLVTHKRIHTGDKPFCCDLCGRAFRQPGNLTRHRLTHTPVKPFPCPICRKAFNRASNLQTHMRTHSKLRPFGCVNCGEAFEHKEDLKQHMNVHDDERSLHCNVCGRTFRKMSQLSQHMHQHNDLFLLRHAIQYTS